MVKPVKKKRKKNVYLIVLSYCQLGLVQLFRILKNMLIKHFIKHAVSLFYYIYQSTHTV